MSICKDTGAAQHAAGTAALGVDVYLAGLVHRPEELPEQQAWAVVIARTCRALVVLDSFAGPTGDGFNETVRAGEFDEPGRTGAAGSWTACQVPSPPSSAAHTTRVIPTASPGATDRAPDGYAQTLAAVMSGTVYDRRPFATAPVDDAHSTVLRHGAEAARGPPARAVSAPA